jgi:preprotein translocase SecE subunit
VARDRQRAKQRKRRAQKPGPHLSQPRRTDVPGELEHASGEVDEFEAALVSGAQGEPAPADEPDDVDPEDRSAPDIDETGSAALETDRFAADDEPEAAADEPEPDDFEDDDEVDDANLEREAVGSAPARRREATPGAPTRRGAGRFIGFLQASWAELQRVQWPDRRQVAQATGVVIGFVIIAGLYLGVADWVAKQVVNAII